MDPMSGTGNTGATRRDNSSNNSGAGASGTVPIADGPRLSGGQRSDEALHSAASLVVPAPADAGPTASAPQFRESEPTVKSSLSDQERCDLARLHMKEKEYDKAFELLRQAEGVLPDVHYLLGRMFIYGLGRPVDAAQAAVWLLMAACKGHVESQGLLGFCFMGQQGLRSDPEQCLFWIEKGALAGNANAMLFMGLFLEQGKIVTKNTDQAFAWYQAAADKGHPGAVAKLGACHQNGWGTPVNIKEALHLYVGAASMGDPVGYYHVACCRQEGIGVSVNPEEAVHCFKKAVEAGFPPAQFRLGKCYWEGHGIPVDKGEAVRLIRLAAVTEARAQQWLDDHKDSLPLGQ